MADTVYVNGVILKEKTFADGGSLINASFKTDEFIAELQKHRGDTGWTNFTICKSKQTSEKGVTHYVKVNTYNPQDKTEGENMSVGKTPTPAVASSGAVDDLPF